MIEKHKLTVCQNEIKCVSCRKIYPLSRNDVRHGDIQMSCSGDVEIGDYVECPGCKTIYFVPYDYRRGIEFVFTDVANTPSSTVLYDVKKFNKFDYPLSCKNGFRTTQVFECEMCGGRTNLATPRFDEIIINCPNLFQVWHKELEGKAHLLNQPHPRSYIEELHQEMEEIKRRNLKNVRHDQVDIWSSGKTEKMKSRKAF